ncbi:9016_t:CDS:1 [Ambispora gerdemannii]|uniref:9016_t:CDS:1 n=1 Tax=Ambispora gerdemannii TaxID=144530 RepID=A0A9N8Z4T9_9GLOM|nr:9016_t:CDS:1 [Ambispora gerdemannii]
MSENGFIINSSESVSNPTETPIIIVIQDPSATATITLPTLPYDNNNATPIETSTQTTATPTIENSPFITSTTSYSPSTIPTIPSQVEQLNYPSSPFSDNNNDIATEQNDVNLASVLVPIFTITFIVIIIGLILYRKRLRDKSRQYLSDTSNSDRTLCNETTVIDGPDYCGDGPFETIYNLSRPRRPPAALLGHRRTSTVLQFEAMHPHVVVVDMENNASNHDSIIIGTDGRDGDCRMIKVLQFDDASESEGKNHRRGCFRFGKK